jgi:hypothetical protein
MLTRSWALHPGGRELDGLSDAPVGHAATDIPGHHGINVMVSRVRVVFEQRRGLHNLPRLTVPALRDLQFEPSGLQRMSAFRIESFNGGNLGSGNRTNRRNA